MEDIAFFEGISYTLGLGDMKEFMPIPGGLLHQMFALYTSSGRFAVKILNSEILRRPGARENFQKAERMEIQLARHGLPICAALTFNGQKMQQYKQRDFYVFPYLEGKPLYPGSLNRQHCEKMGTLCAQLHSAGFQPDGFRADLYSFDWQGLCTRASRENPALYQQLMAQYGLLEAISKRAQKAAVRLPAHSAICHGDLDCKNVLWIGDSPQLIDLECLCRASPWLELMESALCFSGYESRKMEIPLLKAYLRAYYIQMKDDNRQISLDWSCIFDARTNHLAWLEYNVRRALGEDNADAAAQAQATSQINQTLAIIRYQETIRTQTLHTFCTVFA